MEATPRVVIAIRVSTEAQVTEGYGHAAQLERLPHLVREAGWTIARRPDGSEAIYDEGFASTTPEDPGATSLEHRPVMQALLAELEHALLVKRLLAAGVSAIVEAPTLSGFSIRDFDDPSLRLASEISAAVSSYVKTDLKVKLMVGRQQRARQGMPNGGGVPYGYRRPAARAAFIVDEREAEIYRLMVGMVCDHGWGAARIAHELVRLGKPTRSEQSGWTATTVRRILMSKAQCGYVRARFAGAQDADEWVPAEDQPAIVSELDWARMRAVLDARTRESGHNQRRHALAGLLRCAACGKTLKAHPDGRRSKDGRRYLNYSCRVYNSGCTAGYSISEPRALGELGEWVDATLAATDAAGWREDLVVSAPDHGLDEQRVIALDQEVERAERLTEKAYAEFVRAEEIDRRLARRYYEERRDRLTQLTEQRDAARAEYAAARFRTAPTFSLVELRAILTGWREFPDNEKRLALASVIDHAVLGPRQQTPRLTIVPLIAR
jgi:DNA invertase Pin-like site-specific DNA recombinase